MAFEQKPNSGALFKNDKREKDGDPQARGSALIGGVEYWIKAWTNEGAKGKWQKLAFEPKQERQETRRNPSGGYPDDDAF